MKVCKKNLLIWSLSIVALIIAIVFFPRMPETISLSIGANGANLSIDRIALFYVPVIIVLICLKDGPFPFYDKRTEEPPKYASWQLIACALVLAAMIYVIYLHL